MTFTSGVQWVQNKRSLAEASNTKARSYASAYAPDAEFRQSRQRPQPTIPWIDEANVSLSSPACFWSLARRLFIAQWCATLLSISTINTMSRTMPSYMRDSVGRSFSGLLTQATHKIGILSPGFPMLWIANFTD